MGLQPDALGVGQAQLPQQPGGEGGEDAQQGDRRQQVAQPPQLPISQGLLPETLGLDGVQRGDVERGGRGAVGLGDVGQGGAGHVTLEHDLVAGVVGGFQGGVVGALFTGLNRNR